MNYYNTNQSFSAKAIFIEYKNGYAIFQLENNEVIEFEQIDKKIIEVHDLKNQELKYKPFEIYYTEIFDDIDDEDFIIFRLDDLKQL